MGYKEHEVKDKSDFMGLARKELDHRQVKYEKIKMSYEKLDAREKSNGKNLSGLI